MIWRQPGLPLRGAGGKGPRVSTMFGPASCSDRHLQTRGGIRRTDARRLHTVFEFPDTPLFKKARRCLLDQAREASLERNRDRGGRLFRCDCLASGRDHPYRGNAGHGADGGAYSALRRFATNVVLLIRMPPVCERRCAGWLFVTAASGQGGDVADGDDRTYNDWSGGVCALGRRLRAC